MSYCDGCFQNCDMCPIGSITNVRTPSEPMNEVEPMNLDDLGCKNSCSKGNECDGEICLWDGLPVDV